MEVKFLSEFWSSSRALSSNYLCQLANCWFGASRFTRRLHRRGTRSRGCWWTRLKARTQLRYFSSKFAILITTAWTLAFINIFLFIHKIIEKIPLSDGNHYPCFFLNKFCFEELFYFSSVGERSFLIWKSYVITVWWSQTSLPADPTHLTKNSHRVRWITFLMIGFRKN